MFSSEPQCELCPHISANTVLNFYFRHTLTYQSTFIKWKWSKLNYIERPLKFLWLLTSGGINCTGKSGERGREGGSKLEERNLEKTCHHTARWYLHRTDAHTTWRREGSSIHTASHRDSDLCTESVASTRKPGIFSTRGNEKDVIYP